ncbi:helix-turn-helix transcriptional regulator [Paenibacillus sp. XY044]|uniref:helix-turn-helix transcriptional regulator n=1 Tax=Paenibacillus sp. XY044 TaxID=2026089 RepID=UPI000B99D5B7|nr:AraC family transcriptional regulator [Paenibacillus sp. XY044]OZB96245.1 hypothetical protein CJP46_10080 [Paenibacillus sp. XY044]
MALADVHHNFKQFFEGLQMHGSGSRYERMNLHSWMGEGSVQRLAPRQDLGVAAVDFRLNDDYIVALHTQVPMVELSCCVQGFRRVEVAGREFEMRPGSWSLQFANPAEARMPFTKNQPFQMMSIAIPVPAFHRFMENAEGARSVDFHRIIGTMPYRMFQEAYDPASSYLLQQMMETSIRPDSLSLELECRILELLSHAFRSMLLDREQRTSGLSRTDLSKLEQAREILLERMSHPPSLSELSRLIGLNEFKLKTGFKERYGSTVFGYLRDARMETAYRLLQEPHASVTDVSMEVGYSNPSYFAEAFRGKYGMNPGTLIRKS